MFQEYLESYKRIFDFKGRSSRREYWGAIVVDWLIFFVFAAPLSVVGYRAFQQVETPYIHLTIGGILLFLFTVWLLTRSIANFSLQVRRLHDVGYPGWLVLTRFLTFLLFLRVTFSWRKVFYIYTHSYYEPYGYIFYEDYIYLLLHVYLLVVGILISFFIWILFFLQSDPSENVYGPCPHKKVIKKRKPALKKISPAKEGKESSA